MTSMILKIIDTPEVNHPMKKANFFFYKLTIDLNDYNCSPYIYTGEIIRETAKDYICEANGHHLRLSKSIFSNPDWIAEHTPGDDYIIDDDGFDTYMHGYIWFGERTEVVEEICKDIVKRINAVIKPVIQKRMNELKRNINQLNLIEKEIPPFCLKPIDKGTKVSVEKETD